MSPTTSLSDPFIARCAEIFELTKRVENIKGFIGEIEMAQSVVEEL